MALGSAAPPEALTVQYSVSQLTHSTASLDVADTYRWGMRMPTPESTLASEQQAESGPRRGMLSAAPPAWYAQSGVRSRKRACVRD
jgi:hypothetical protein